jgi:hypothetical protein
MVELAERLHVFLIEVPGPPIVVWMAQELLRAPKPD